MKKLFKKPLFWIIVALVLLSLFFLLFIQYLSEGFHPFINRFVLTLSLWFFLLAGILIYILIQKGIDEEAKKRREEAKKVAREKRETIKKQIKTIRKDFKRALHTIRKSSLFKRQNSYRYELPWYLVYGQPNDGKTSLLEFSGLDFPLNVNYSDRLVRDSSHTETFVWYYTEKAVFVDMPGRFVQRENPEIDEPVWNSFLKYFQRKRWRRPLNALILTFNVEKLMSESEQALDAYARKLRSQFDEIGQTFHQILPIYLVLTKGDTIRGFVEYFSAMTTVEKQQIFGVTFPDDEKTGADSHLVESEFDELVKRINAQLFDRVHREANERNKAETILFPMEFSQLIEKLRIIVDICFSETRYHHSLRLRGIYTTSACYSVKKEEGDGRQLNLPYVASKTGFFIKDLLEKIIFPESDIVKIEKSYRKKLILAHIASLGFALSLILGSTYLLLKDFSSRMDFFNNTSNANSEYSQRRNIIAEQAELDNILEILDQAALMYEASLVHGTNLIINPAFYRINNRHTLFHNIYEEALVSLYLPRVQDRLLRVITNLQNDYDYLWSGTQAYLMLSMPEKRDNKILADWYAMLMAEDYEGQTAKQQRLNRHWENLLDYGFDSLLLNERLLARVQNQLKEQDQSHLIYREFRRQAEDMGFSDFRFSHTIGEFLFNFTGVDYSIPGMYTKMGFQALFATRDKKFVKDLAHENWVVGYAEEMTDAELNKIYSSLQNLYFSDYKNYWFNALHSIKVQSFSQLNDVNRQLTSFNSPDSPVVRMLLALKENTEIYTPAEEFQKEIEEKTAEGLSESALIALKRSFEKARELMDNRATRNLRMSFDPFHNLITKEGLPSPQLEQGFASLEMAFSDLAVLRNSVTVEQDAFALVKGRVSGEYIPIRLLPGQLPSPIDSWIQSVLYNNWAYIVSQAREYVNTIYKEEILPYYNRNIAGRFPFSDGSDVELVYFNNFFMDTGIFNRFFNECVLPFVENKGYSDRLFLRDIDGSTMDYNNSFMVAANNYSHIYKTMYDRSGRILNVEFHLKPYELSKNLGRLEFKHGNQLIEYAHGPIRGKSIKWPLLDSDPPVSSYTIYSLDGSEIEKKESFGEWALFHMFNSLELKRWSDVEGSAAILLEYTQGSYRGKYVVYGDFVQNLATGTSPINFILPQETLNRRGEESNGSTESGI